MLYFALCFEAVAVIGGSILLGWWLDRSLGTRWSTWLWGGAAFIVAQMVHIPVLIALTVIGKKFAISHSAAPWINVLILGGTAGLFENVSRFLFLRGPAKSARSWKEGVMFGAGHGGVEAIFVIATGVISAFVMLIMGEKILSSMKAASPDQLAAAAHQIAAVRNMPWWTPLLAIWERAMAITLQIALALLVLRAVVRRQLRWLWAAVGFHGLVDGTAVALQQVAHADVLIVEAAVTAFSIGSAAIIVWTRRSDAAAC